MTWRMLLSFGLVGLAVLVACRTQASPMDSPKTTYGDRQVEQLLDDRPDMRGVFSPASPIYRWVVQQFDSGDQGRRVFWDVQEPASGQPAEHMQRYSLYPAYVRVSGATSSTGIDKWAMLVYEFHNLQNSPEISTLTQKAAKRSITAAHFAAEATRLEHQALLKTRQFFQKNPIAGAKPDRDASYAMILNTPETFEEFNRYLDSFGGGSYDPRKYFESQYEAIGRQK